jgi:AcrR family transcriptional regulator
MNAETSRRGAPKRGEPTARDRLVATTIELFYQEGIRAIGIDTVIAKSGVSKSSLYRTFASKDELIEAFAEEQNLRFWQWWDDVVNPFHGNPRAMIEALMNGLADLIASPQFRGCPFINIATEFPDPKHPATAIAYANKLEVHERLTTLSQEMGAHDPKLLGDQLALLMDGAYSQAAMTGTADLKKVIVESTTQLINQQIKVN